MIGKKYARVQTGIVNLIVDSNLSVGDTLPAEKELADRFGVSIVTIRHAVSNLVETGILRRVHGSGTFVTSEIAGKLDNGNIIFLNVNREGASFPVFEASSDVIGGLLTDRGYHLQVIATGQSPTASTVKALNKAVGVIAIGWVTNDWIKILNALNIPAVFIGSVVDGDLKLPSVDFNWKMMAEMLTKHLIDGGAKKVGAIFGGTDYVPTLQAHAGFRDALENFGLEYVPDDIFYSDYFDVAHSLREFLDAREYLDGLLVERGAYVHVVNTLFNKRHRPAIGVMCLDASQSVGICEKLSEAFFKENIYAKSVERLLLLMETDGNSTENVKIAPYLHLR